MIGLVETVDGDPTSVLCSNDRFEMMEPLVKRFCKEHSLEYDKESFLENEKLEGTNGFKLFLVYPCII